MILGRNDELLCVKMGPDIFHIIPICYNLQEIDVSFKKKPVQNLRRKNHKTRPNLESIKQILPHDTSGVIDEECHEVPLLSVQQKNPHLRRPP
jgi:hypothetical protein